MRIGFIAMSGVRAWSEELNRAGLTMPGVVERSRVIASLPSLSLLTLAGLTPPDIEVEYREIRDLRAEGLPADRYDLVAISSFSAQVFDAYTVADHYRSLGVPVVLGGLHVTALPDEAAAHADSIVIGEAEPHWPRLLADWRAGQLRPRYELAENDPEFDFAHSPMPRFDLLDIEKYNRIPVQTSRGCPHQCEFCAGSILLTRAYKVKPVERIIAEIHEVKRLWRHPFIEFADDNSFVNRKHAHALCEALIPERVRWFTEVDISIANDPDLLELMRRAGCREVLIGLESPSPAGLDRIETRANWKLRQLSRYEEGVRRIQDAGIAVNGCFILGLDGDTEATFDEVFAFAERAGLFDVQITVQTPFPGTPMYSRLLSEGRIIAPGAWDRCTLFDVNFIPRAMTPDRLQRGLLELAHRLYEPSFVARRRQGFLDTLSRRGLPAPAEAA